MQISRFFLNKDIKGAIEYMRNHDEIKDVLPAYIAIYENCEYRKFEIPSILNDILLLYQVYFRDVFYCGLSEEAAADKLLTQLKMLMNMPKADEEQLTKNFNPCLKKTAIIRFSEKPRGITALIFGKKQSRQFFALNFPTKQRNTQLTFLRTLYSEAGWTI